MEEIAWYSNWKAFRISGGSPRLMKTRKKVIRCDLKKKKVSKDLTKDRSARKLFGRNCLTNGKKKNILLGSYDDDKTVKQN